MPKQIKPPIEPMKKKEQCKDRWEISSELNIACLCIKQKGHKGFHKFLWPRYSKKGQKIKTRVFFSR